MAECRQFPNVIDSVVSDHWAHGGETALDFAQSALTYLDSDKTSQATQLYPSEWSLSDKIAHLAREIHGASSVTCPKETAASLSKFEKNATFPVCLAKMQY